MGAKSTFMAIVTATANNKKKKKLSHIFVIEICAHNQCYVNLHTQ